MYKVAVKIPIEYFKNNCVPWEFNRGSENFCTKIYSAKFRDAKYGTDQLRIFKKNRMKKKNNGFAKYDRAKKLCNFFV